MALAIWRPQPDDWERVRAVRLQALQDAPGAFATLYEKAAAESDDIWQTRLESSEAATFMATRDVQDIGMAVGAPYGEDLGLFAMWVAPGARGQGAAVGLVEAVINWARSRGGRALYLDVADDNVAAQRLYARHGFVPTGECSAFPPPRTHLIVHQLKRLL